jgi:hypothetical protein
VEFLMEQEMAKSQPTNDYQSYVIKRQLDPLSSDRDPNFEF